MSNEKIMKTTGFREVQKPDYVKELLDKWILEGNSSLGVWAAEESTTGDLLGWFMLKKVMSDDPELGFMITESKWGNGFATEIAKELIDYAFNTLSNKRVIASTDKENTSSINVLEKIGMKKYKGCGPQKDILYFEITLN
jgi:ribosomal-protein-alanine N-acetyltransferase